MSPSAPPHSRWHLTAPALVAILAAAKLLLHLYAARSYGHFTDELYNLALARHLDWGYVDVAPMIGLIGRIELSLFGSSLTAIRIAPALAGAALVVLTAAIARELGGGRFAQAFAALAVIAAPGILVVHHLFTVNAFEPLCWMGCALVLLRIVRTGNHRLWLWFGLVAGLGLETKHSMLMFGFALVAGLLLTRERTHLFNRWLLFGGAAAFLLFLPNLLWNIQHHFPFFEIQANIRRAGRDVSLSLPAFLGQETLAMLPTSLPLWAAGLWQLARSRFRALAFAWLFTAAIVFALSPRVYYLFPAFPMLFAAGAVQWEAWLSGPRTRWIRAAWVALTLAAGALIAPTMIPLLPPETYIRYAKAIHLDQPRIENHRLGPLPQLFADQFGWEEMTATVADAYRSLPPAIRARTAIFAQNYGQAGAIDLFGPRYGLPSAISGHQNYYLWGTHGATGDSLIVMGDSQEALERIFLSVRKMAHASHPYSMPYQHIDIFYCTGPRIPLAGLWPQIKAWH